MNIAFVQNSENDVDHADGHQERQTDISNGALKCLRVAGEAGRHRLRQNTSGQLRYPIHRGPQGVTRLHVERNGDRGELAGVRDGLRSDLRLDFRQSIEGNQRALARFEIDFRKRIGQLLIGWLDFLEHMILARGSVDGAGDLRTESAIKSCLDLSRVQPIARRALAVDMHVLHGVLDLQVSGNVAHFGEPGNLLLDNGRLFVEFVGVWRLQGELIGAIGQARADANGLIYI